MATRNASLSSPQWGRCLASRAMMVASGTASVWTAQHFQAQQHVPFDVLLGKQVRGEKRMGLLLTEHARAHVCVYVCVCVCMCVYVCVCVSASASLSLSLSVSLSLSLSVSVCLSLSLSVSVSLSLCLCLSLSLHLSLSLSLCLSVSLSLHLSLSPSVSVLTGSFDQHTQSFGTHPQDGVKRQTWWLARSVGLRQTGLVDYLRHLHCIFYN